ncbi:MAG: hypothetical protein LQ340_002673 [Diploschistes diacapsis]|nr:MAG: hypothetical protein LQ340_002673 [Diploschistes diacapsis]
MRFAPSIVGALIAWGGLASAQHGISDGLKEERDLSARDVLRSQTRPQPPPAWLYPKLQVPMPSMLLSRLQVAAMLMAPSTPHTIRLSCPSRRIQGPRRAKSLVTSLLQPSIPKALLVNPNGYTMTTTIRVERNGPRPIMQPTARPRVSSYSAIQIPLEGSQKAMTSNGRAQYTMRVSNNRMMQDVRRKKAQSFTRKQLAAINQMEKVQAFKHKAAMEAALTLEANQPPQLDKSGLAGPKAQSPRKNKAKEVDSKHSADSEDEEEDEEEEDDDDEVDEVDEDEERDQKNEAKRRF